MSKDARKNSTLSDNSARVLQLHSVSKHVRIASNGLRTAQDRNQLGRCPWSKVEVRVGVVEGPATGLVAIAVMVLYHKCAMYPSDPEPTAPLSDFRLLNTNNTHSIMQHSHNHDRIRLKTIPSSFFISHFFSETFRLILHTIVTAHRLKNMPRRPRSALFRALRRSGPRCARVGCPIHDLHPDPESRSNGGWLCNIHQNDLRLSVAAILWRYPADQRTQGMVEDAEIWRLLKQEKGWLKQWQW